LLSIITFNETLHPTSPDHSLRIADIHVSTQPRPVATLDTKGGFRTFSASAWSEYIYNESRHSNNHEFGRIAAPPHEGSEPNLFIRFSRRVRSQNGNCSRRMIVDAAMQQGNGQFQQPAARPDRRIYNIRDELARRHWRIFPDCRLANRLHLRSGKILALPMICARLAKIKQSQVVKQVASQACERWLVEKLPAINKVVSKAISSDRRADANYSA